MELQARTTIRDHRGTVVLAVALMVVVALAAALIGTRLLPSSRAERTALSTAPANSLQPVPTFGHVFVIVLENRSASSVLGSADAPYLNSLAAGSGSPTPTRPWLIRRSRTISRCSAARPRA